MSRSMSAPPAHTLVRLLLPLGLAALHAPAQAAAGELRLTREPVAANAAGPLAQALRLVPGLAAPVSSATTAAVEWKDARHLGADWTLDAVAQDSRRDADGAADAALVVNEGFAGGALGTDNAWQWSAGRRIVSWDVGYAFRPNDVVQQEARRRLLSSTPPGRHLLALERFGADDALALVWVNPGHARATAPRTGAEEEALATRLYLRRGALDLHGFARWGAHTRASVGAAAAWVAADDTELHASARWMRRHDGWQSDAGAGASTLVEANPWQQASGGNAWQALIGGQWTGAAQQSLLVEAWHDGSAPSDDAWRAWRQRNAGLAAFAALPGLPADARLAAAANLAWQATPLGGPGLRQDNVYARAAWQQERWQLSLDGLWMPADGGRVHTAQLQWQGEAWRLEAGWRVIGGPSASVAAQLPARRSGVIAGVRSF